jgi:UDP-N-acetylglucosamine diphosphorylase/glucosamine-1-phosphate N-acetyltransferase
VSRPAPLYLYDDALSRAFEPFALTRPASELRVGAELVRRRWERALGAKAAAFLGAPHLEGFSELDAPPFATGQLPTGAIVANARFSPRLLAADPEASVWRADGRIAALRLGAPIAASEFADGRATLDDALLAGGRRAHEATIEGWWADEVWHLLRDLQAQLADDVPRLAATLECDRAPSTTVLGTHGVFVEGGAVIEPLVVLDATAGPVLVRRGAVVQAFTRLVGPCYVGENATVIGDRVSGCSIGELAKVRGEISASVVLGHANKGHDGFVGHSYLGRWVNLGAGTTTSNLKNTYGSVALATRTGLRDTGMQFLGTLFGDHAKTGIGLRLTTGSVIGAGANVYGSAMPPKAVPPFAWGDGAPYASFGLDKFLVVAERAMSRRHVPLDDGMRRMLTAAYERREQAALDGARR